MVCPRKLGEISSPRQAVIFRPFPRESSKSQKFYQSMKMDCEILVDGFFLRSMVPMMESGHDQKFFEPFGVGTEIAMSPGSVKE